MEARVRFLINAGLHRKRLICLLNGDLRRRKCIHPRGFPYRQPTAGPSAYAPRPWTLPVPSVCESSGQGPPPSFSSTRVKAAPWEPIPCLCLTNGTIGWVTLCPLGQRPCLFPALSTTTVPTAWGSAEVRSRTSRIHLAPRSACLYGALRTGFLLPTKASGERSEPPQTSTSPTPRAAQGDF